MLGSRITTLCLSTPQPKRLASVPILVPLVLLVAAGCGSSDNTATTNPGTVTTTTAAVETTITSPLTTTAVPTTASTTVPANTSPTTTATTAPTTTSSTSTTVPTTAGARDRYVVGEPGVFPRSGTTTGPLPGSEGAGGSGCAPATTSLPDGIWFGFVAAKADTSITFDLACYYFGPVAMEEGAKDNVDVDNEIYIRNANATVRTITVDPSVLVYEYFEDLTDTIEVPFNPALFADWPQDPTYPHPCPGESCGVWLFVNGDAVTEMMEQLSP